MDVESIACAAACDEAVDIRSDVVFCDEIWLFVELLQERVYAIEIGVDGAL